MSGRTGAGPANETIVLADEGATVALGARIGAELEAGDLVALHGEIGAGKTTLARAVLRAWLGDGAHEVPSPTFTLAQTYEGPDGSVVHADLYRVGGEAELVELGFDEWRERSAVLVEWPDRAPNLLAVPRLDVSLTLDTASGERRAVLSGDGPLVERIARTRAGTAMLASAGWGEARHDPMSGDASTRLYRRLVRPNGETAILMISPPRPDGPAVRRGRSYSAIARLAESVHAFSAIDRALVEAGFSAPRILAEDLDAGLMLIEDLGADTVLENGVPMPERYAEAVRCLVALHGTARPDTVSLPDDGTYPIPPFDLDAMLIEVELLLDWYLPVVAGVEPSGSVRAEFGHAWREVLLPLTDGPKTWVLRDFHSPNIVWLGGRSGIDRVGLIDFQDAVMGSPAYDVASLLQDARVDVPPDLELKLLGLYAGSRRAADPGFDTAAFAGAYAVMGAQRNTKILGIFARLNRRDGKPGYMKHLPRIENYLRRDLDHPALSRVRTWFVANCPGLVAEPAGDATEPAA